MIDPGVDRCRTIPYHDDEQHGVNDQIGETRDAADNNLVR